MYHIGRSKGRSRIQTSRGGPQRGRRSARSPLFNEVYATAHTQFGLIDDKREICTHDAGPLLKLAFSRCTLTTTW
jgi:hypothetical protein